jgi:alanine racemase
MEQAEAVIDTDAIASNVHHLAAGTCAQVMAVVKADGYGHGLVPSARASLAGGATWLGVCTLAEALTLRAAGLTAPILAWLWAPGQPVPEAIGAEVDLSVSDLRSLGEVVEAVRRVGRPARVHLKVDTGLGRNGATRTLWPEVVEAAARAEHEGLLRVVGVWSHFAHADDPGHPVIGDQIVAFREAVTLARAAGLDPEVRHLANSAATLTLPEAHFDLVRPGVSIYGLSPVPDLPQARGLRPAMTLQGRVVLTKRVPAGHGVSYGHTYHTARETTLALVPLGYADGVPRHASNIGPLLLGGTRRTIAGRVCMDQIMVDIGDDPVSPGDLAVLFGPGGEGEPTADDWAEAIGTISYEMVTRIGTRVPRRYLGSAMEGVTAPDPQ